MSEKKVKYEDNLDIKKIKVKNDDFSSELWLLEKAYEIRNFEIDKYWQRSTYFTLFISAIFIGYYQDSLQNNSFLRIVLEILGFCVSYIWYLSNRGAKFWQENWEKHIDFLEDDVGKLYKSVFIKKNKFSDILGAYPISPAKCNTMISIIITFAWFLLILKEIFSFIPLEDLYNKILNNYSSNIYNLIIIFLLLLTGLLIGLCFCLIKALTSGFAKDFFKLEKNYMKSEKKKNNKEDNKEDNKEKPEIYLFNREKEQIIELIKNK
jgi:hypothetical protein